MDNQNQTQNQPIDYDALAKQYGATSSAPQGQASQQAQPAQTGQVDYDALAKQYGATSSVPATTDQGQQQQTTEKPGYFSGVYKTTFAPLVNLGRDLSNYYSKKPVPIVNTLDPTAGALGFLKDAVKDPEHPLHKIALGIAQSHADTAKKAYAKGQEAVAAAKQGDYCEAGKALSEATGYGVATALPGIGPAAAEAGETIGKGAVARQTGKAIGSEALTKEGTQEMLYGAGQGTGLIASVTAPEAVGKAGKTVAGKVTEAIGPRTAEIAGESIPVRASQESGAAGTLENVAPSKTLSKFDIEQTQPAAKGAIGKVASGVESKAIAGQTLPAVAKDLGERAEQIEAQSQPVFKKLDTLSEADVKAGTIKTKFSDLQKAEKSAYRKGDYEAVAEAKAQQQDLMDRYADQFDPADLSNARANWRQARALDKVDAALNKTVGPTPVEFRPKGTADPGYINGKAFSKKIMDLQEKGTLDAAGLTPEHIQSLQDLGTLLEKSSNVHKFSSLLTKGGALGELLYVGTHPVAAVGASKAAVPAYLVSRALGRVMTDPAAADAVVKALQMGAKVGRATSLATQPAYGATKDVLSGSQNENEGARSVAHIRRP